MAIGFTVYHPDWHGDEGGCFGLFETREEAEQALEGSDNPDGAWCHVISIEIP